MLWQKATSTYTYTTTGSPEEESTSEIHTVSKASAVSDTAGRIILLFCPSEESQVWIWRAFFHCSLSCKFEGKWLHTGAGLTPP